jgi:hypothetical protein
VKGAKVVIDDSVVCSTDVLATRQYDRFIMGLVDGDVASFQAPEASVPFELISLVIDEVIVESIKGLLQDIDERALIRVQGAKL